MNSIPGLGRSPGVGNDSPLHYSSPGLSRTEEPGELQFMGSQESVATEQLNTHTHTQAQVHTHAHRLHKACPAAIPKVANALPTLLPSQPANALCDRSLVGLLQGSRCSRGRGPLTWSKGRGSAIRLTAPAEPGARGWGALMSEDSGRGCWQGL